MSFMDNFEDHMKSADNHIQALRNEYERLAAAPPKKVRVGDKVIAAIGILGHGHYWIREECEVTAVAGTSAKIEWDSYGSKCNEWVDVALIVAIVPKDKAVNDE